MPAKPFQHVRRPLDEHRDRDGLLGPEGDMRFIVSENAEVALELEVARLRLKDRATKRQLEGYVHSLKGAIGKGDAKLELALRMFALHFPEAA